MSEFKFFDVGMADPIGKYAQPKPYGAVSGNATVAENQHGIKNHKAKGVMSKAMKQVGRNLARAKNQRGK